MEYISDSDAENSLPLLSPSDIDRDLLRDVFSFFSEGTKQRLRQEALNTQFEHVYDDIEAAPIQENDEEMFSGEPERSLSTETEIQSNAIAPEMPENDMDLRPGTSRSLRKRTFASRHPYIADQADWLGICSVESINEMFTGDEDLAKVVKALNQFYLKKKDRYPDEDRYKARNFYVHLGKSKLMALQGDVDSNSQDIIQAAHDSESQEQTYDPEDEEDEEELIPYEGFAELLRPHLENTEPRAHSNEASDSSSQLESEESEVEEQLIKIGGKYRKLSSILRGVLPESAKRLGAFQDRPPKRKKKKISRLLEPRKGLAMRKYGASSTQSAELQRELTSFIGDSDHEEEYIPNHSKMVQPLITESGSVSAPLSRQPSGLGYKLDSPDIQIVSSSDYESDSVEEVFSDGGIFNQGDDLSRMDPHTSYEIDAEGAIESDMINHLFAPASKSKLLKKHTSATKLGGGKPRMKRDAAPSSNRSRPTQYAKRKLTKPNIDKKDVTKKRSIGIKKQRLVFPSREGNPSPGAHPLQVRRHENRPAKAEAKSKNTKKDEKPTSDAGVKSLPFQQPFKRNPYASTPIFEVESSKPRLTLESFYNAIPQHFLPTRESLFGTSSVGNTISLLGFDDAYKVNDIGDGHIFFPNESNVSFVLIGKEYVFSLILPDDAKKSGLRFFSQLRRLVLNESIFLNGETREELHQALLQFIKWKLIERERPSEDSWALICSVLDEFSKLQTRLTRQHQIVTQAQILFILWIMISLEVLTVSSRKTELSAVLDKFTTDFWVMVFQTLSASELSESASETSSTHRIYESIVLIYSIYKDRPDVWWPQISMAIGELVDFGDTKSNLLQLNYILAAMVPKSQSSWGPFIAFLTKFKDDCGASVYHSFIDICELIHYRLDWSFDERVLTQLYGTFASRKFSNFLDETTVPRPISFVNSRSDCPSSSAFDHLLGLLYTYVNDLTSKKDVKRFVSKLLISSQYRYENGRKSQIMFVNRLNLITLLYQVSNVDLNNQFTGLVHQIQDSNDMFIYGRTSDALEVITETGIKRGIPVPFKSFEILLNAFCERYAKLFGMPQLLSRLIDFMGQIFQGYDESSNYGLMNLLIISCNAKLDMIPNRLNVNFFGTLLVGLFELLGHKKDIRPCDLITLKKFHKTILSVLSMQMGRFPLSDPRADDLVESNVELVMQMWNVTSDLLEIQHWNTMMLQKYPYLGNAYLRDRFVMFFCSDYMVTGLVDEFVLSEVDRILLKGLASPLISKYASKLYFCLIRNKQSIFAAQHVFGLDLTLVAVFSTYRFQIISNVIQNLLLSSKFIKAAKVAFLRDFLQHLHDQISAHYQDHGYLDFCKRIMEMVQRIAKDYVSEIDVFWELSARLGMPNKRMQLTWSKANLIEKLQIINNEFLTALHYNKDQNQAITTWITRDNVDILFSLVEVYITGVLVNDAHWAHLSYLLKIILKSISAFEVPVQDLNFHRFLRLLEEISIISKRGRNTNYVLFELSALETSTIIYTQAYYFYDGYKDQEEVIEMAENFATALDSEPPLSSKYREPIFTDVTFGKLRSASHLTHHPNFQHTIEDYSRAYSQHEAELSRLKLLFDVKKEATVDDFNLEL